MADSISGYFKEIAAATNNHQELWAKDLYGPILLVNSQTRQIYANVPDANGEFKFAGNIYSGTLPREINIANTAVTWNGIRWAMVMLPLPDNKPDRISLLAHELFHVSQPSLGFELYNYENNHLDRRDGRVFLRLELAALTKALQTPVQSERKSHIANALTFRKQRNLLFPGSDTTENLLELNEGLAEYTGAMIGGGGEAQLVEHFTRGVNTFLNNPTFVRSFAYQTTPIYGFLLQSSKKGWNHEITVRTNLAEYFAGAFGISLPVDISKTVEDILPQYKGELIKKEENARMEKANARIAEYKLKFITLPHTELRFEKMNVSFDPRNIVPVEDKGSVYPSIRVSDNWGILTVENGALMSTNWDKIAVALPTKTDGRKISGDGWVLELNEGYILQKNMSTGNYELMRRK